MNREIVIGFLKEHEENCHRSLSQLLKQKQVCTFCYNVNRDTLLLITSMKEARKTVDVGLALSPESETDQYHPYKTAGFKFFHQRGKTEAEKIKNIFNTSFGEGYQSVVILAHGVPNIPPCYLEDAITDLRKGLHLVLGPLVNGKFYLIGMTKSEYLHISDSKLFSKMDFQNGVERDQTINLIKDSCAHYSVLPEWYIIKSYEDLKRLLADSEQGIGWNARWTNCIASDIV